MFSLSPVALRHGGSRIRSFGIGSNRQDTSYSAIPSVVFGDKTGDNTPLSKRGVERWRDQPAIYTCNRKMGVGGHGFWCRSSYRVSSVKSCSTHPFGG